jgi:hypothetical protein
MLGHQLPALPPLASFLDELPAVFAWLEGTPEPTALAALTGVPGASAVDESWAPPPTIWRWGPGTPIEAIRFAAANHLCVELGYQGSLRLIEPYSLRRTMAGDLLLYAVKAESAEVRGYRVDRITSSRVTTRVFHPRYLVELTGIGQLSVLPTSRRSGAAPIRRLSPSRRTPGPIYRVECPVCRRQFERTTRNLRLRQHKDLTGDACAGTRGFVAGIGDA